MPRGSLVIYNTDMIHRAAPMTSSKERKSLFFQVEKKENAGEPILLNTSFARELNDELKYYLGFGAHTEYEVFPQTGLETMRSGPLLSLAAKALGHSFSAAVANRLWMLPPDSRARLKALARKISKSNGQ
jgi:hypothetical protein